MPKNSRTRVDHIEDAAQAHTDLNVFHAVMGMMEGGLLSADSYADAEKVIGICRRARTKCLARYDIATAKAKT